MALYKDFIQAIKNSSSIEKVSANQIDQIYCDGDLEELIEDLNANFELTDKTFILMKKGEKIIFPAVDIPNRHNDKWIETILFINEGVIIN